MVYVVVNIILSSKRKETGYNAKREKGVCLLFGTRHHRV